MYYTGVDPRTMEKVYVTTDPHEQAMQRALIQYRNPKNYALVEEALKKAGREDLIGYDKRCLIRPRQNGKHFDIQRDTRYADSARDTGKGRSGAKPAVRGNSSRTNKDTNSRNRMDKRSTARSPVQSRKSSKNVSHGGRQTGGSKRHGR